MSTVSVILRNESMEPGAQSKTQISRGVMIRLDHSPAGLSWAATWGLCQLPWTLGRPGLLHVAFRPLEADQDYAPAVSQGRTEGRQADAQGLTSTCSHGVC